MARVAQWPEGAGVDGSLIPAETGAQALLRPMPRRPLLDWIVYRPSHRMIGTPKERGLDYEDIQFAAADGTPLHGWFIPGRGPWVWLWFHGSAGNISTRLEGIKLAHHRLGASIFIFDYRGYGRSGGRVSEEGVYMDAEAAYLQLLHRGVSPKRLLLYGKSLGGAVAIHLAAQREARALLVEATFTRMCDMAKKSGWVAWLPWNRLLPCYDSISKIKNIRIPTLVIHGERDSLVPPSYGQQLYIAANAPKEFYLVPRAHHSDSCFVGGAAYHRRLADFLDRLGKAPQPDISRKLLVSLSRRSPSRFPWWPVNRNRRLKM